MKPDNEWPGTVISSVSISDEANSRQAAETVMSLVLDVNE